MRRIRDIRVGIDTGLYRNGIFFFDLSLRVFQAVSFFGTDAGDIIELRTSLSVVPTVVGLRALVNGEA